MPHRVRGQDQTAPPDSVVGEEALRQRQLVQLSPHLLLFDPHTTTATLEFRNPSDHVRQAQVQVQFAYIDVPHGLPADTVVIDPRPVGTGTVYEVHDTVVTTPGVQAPFAGRWLAGVPASVTLAPHQTKRVTVRLTPPPHVPPGEYWARIVTLVSPTDPRHGGQDVRQQYALPTHGLARLLRDTCAVIYRQGPLHLGLAIGPDAVARLDSANLGGAGSENFSHALWLRLPLRLTGNVPFRGMIHSAFSNVSTGEVVDPDQLEFSFMKNGVLHLVVETDRLAPGTWEYTVTFDTENPDLPPALRLPMVPVRHVFRFEVLPSWQY